MRRYLVIFVTAICVLLFTGLAFAPIDPIPHMINYQGMLTNDEGTPLNGLYDLTFRIYDVPSGGTALWTGNYNDEEVQDGLFNVILEIPASVFNGAERYMGITVWPDAELSPRTRLTSVGYAYVAETAVTSGTDGDWTISGDNMYSAASGKVGIGETSPGAKLHVNGSGDTYGIMAEGGSSYSIRSLWDGSSLGAAILAKNTGTGGDAIQAMAEGSGRSAVWARGNTGVDYAIYGSANGATWAGYFSGDVYASGNVGIGTTSPSSKLQVYYNSTNYLGFDASAGPEIKYKSGSYTWTVSSPSIYSGNWFMIKVGGTDRLQIHQDGTLNYYGNPVYLRNTYSNSISSGRDLYISSIGELGYLSSSIRYKKNIRPLDGYSSKIYGLRPVAFDFKEDEEAVNQFGLIAEEVEKVLPELVSYDEKQRPETVLYSKLVPLLLNEVIHIREQNEALNERIRQLENQLSGLSQK